MLRSTNIKSSKLCAFCKYWYDPANTAILPKNVKGGFWQYDDSVWNICQLRGTKRRSGMGCVKYITKIT